MLQVPGVNESCRPASRGAYVEISANWKCTSKNMHRQHLDGPLHFRWHPWTNVTHCASTQVPFFRLSPFISLVQVSFRACPMSLPCHCRLVGLGVTNSKLLADTREQVASTHDDPRS
jgi:hypothetical protein